MEMTIRNIDDRKLMIPKGKMASGDFFKCEKCGYTTRMLVLGNTATCPQCGGKMNRV